LRRIKNIEKKKKANIPQGIEAKRKEKGNSLHPYPPINPSPRTPDNGKEMKKSINPPGYPILAVF